jgi:hypothetical protein
MYFRCSPHNHINKINILQNLKHLHTGHPTSYRPALKTFFPPQNIGIMSAIISKHDVSDTSCQQKGGFIIMANDRHGHSHSHHACSNDYRGVKRETSGGILQRHDAHTKFHENSPTGSKVTYKE